MAQFNFRLFLRPTAIGRVIIDRLSEEGADRQADSRRWIELGYAVEQAGFRLDGTTVYQGAHRLAVDQPAAIHAPVALVPTAALQPAPAAPLGVAAAPGAAVTPVAPAQPPARVTAPSPAVELAAAGSVTEAPTGPVVHPSPVIDEMTNNLRNLSA